MEADRRGLEDLFPRMSTFMIVPKRVFPAYFHLVKNMFYFPLLVLNGIYHYWTCFFFLHILFQCTEANGGLWNPSVSQRAMHTAQASLRSVGSRSAASRSPSNALSHRFVGWEGSPAKIDDQKKWVPLF